MKHKRILVQQYGGTTFDGALNSDILIDFLKRLIRDAGRKVYLILDNQRVHHSKPVKAWLPANAHAIEVFYLPSFSPELNPDEMANALSQTGGHEAGSCTNQASTRQSHCEALAQRSTTA